MTNKIATILLASIFVFATACSFRYGANEATNANQNGNTGQAASNDSKQTNSAVTTQNANLSTNRSSQNCSTVTLPGKTLIKKQTFTFDHKPFNGACFVTFGSKQEMLEETDVPRGSTFYIYRDGKQVFTFPDAFGGQSACWVEGVAFNDLNGDGLTDVAMAGSCLAARDSYPSNAVYVNTGSGFTTDDQANEKLQDLRSLKEIEAFVKKNVKSFF